MTKWIPLLLLLPTLARAAAVCPCPCPPIDDQQCYETPRKNTLRPPIHVTIADSLGGLIEGNLTTVHRLCTPANKNGDCPGCPQQADHYIGVELHQITGTLATGSRTVTAQFGTVTGTLGNAGFVQLPAGKSLTFPAPPPLAGLRSYNCYVLDAPTGPGVNGAVHTVDQFATLDYALAPNKTWTLCAPANIDGTDPGALSDPNLFLCNLVNDAGAKLPFNELSGFFNAFLVGPRPFTITRLDNLCMPATLL